MKTINNLIHCLHFVPPITSNNIKELNSLTDAEINELYSLMGKKQILVPTLQHNKLVLEYLRSSVSNITPQKNINITQYIPSSVLPIILKHACITIANDDEDSLEASIIYNFPKYQEYLDFINKQVNLGNITVFKYRNGYSDEDFEQMVHKIHKEGSKNYVIMDEFINNYILNEELTNVETMCKNILGTEFYTEYSSYVRYRIIDGYLKKYGGNLPLFINIPDFIELCLPNSTINNHKSHRHFKKVDFIKKYVKTGKFKTISSRLFLDLVDYGGTKKIGDNGILRPGYHKLKSGLLNLKVNLHKKDPLRQTINYILQKINTNIKKNPSFTEAVCGVYNKEIQNNQSITQLINKINNYRAKRLLNQYQLPDLIVNKNNGISVINLMEHAGSEPNSEIKEQYLLLILKIRIMKHVLGMKYCKVENGSTENNENGGTTNNPLYNYSLLPIGDIHYTTMEDIYRNYKNKLDTYTIVFNEDRTRGLILFRDNQNSKNIHRYQYHIEYVFEMLGSGDGFTDNNSKVKCIHLNKKIPLFLDFTDKIKFNQKTINVIIDTIYYKYCNMVKIGEIINKNGEIGQLLLEDQDNNIKEFKKLIK